MLFFFKWKVCFSLNVVFWLNINSYCDGVFTLGMFDLSELWPGCPVQADQEPLAGWICFQMDQTKEIIHLKKDMEMKNLSSHVLSLQTETFRSRIRLRIRLRPESLGSLLHWDRDPQIQTLTSKNKTGSGLNSDQTSNPPDLDSDPVIQTYSHPDSDPKVQTRTLRSKFRSLDPDSTPSTVPPLALNKCGIPLRVQLNYVSDFNCAQVSESKSVCKMIFVHNSH